MVNVNGEDGGGFGKEQAGYRRPYISDVLAADMDWPYIYWLYVYILTWIGHTYWHAMAINMLAIYILTCIDMLTIYIGTDWPYTHTLDMVSSMVKELIKCVEIECYSCKTLPDF